MTAPPLDPQHRAERVRDHMWANDRASQALGMRITAIGAGRATMQMPIRADMLNGLDICHGGLVATLADSTFAFACNAYDEMTVASGFSVDLVAPARLGDVLTADAVEVSKAGRTGVYDITVTNQRGERVAMFRGRSYTMKGRPVVPVDSRERADVAASANLSASPSTSPSASPSANPSANSSA